MRRAIVCCLVLSLLLSGCASLDRSPPSDGTSADADVRVDGELPVDVDVSQVYERVQRLLDVDARETVTVRIRERPDPPDDGSAGGSFIEYLGADDTVDGDGRAVAKSGTNVVVYANDSWSAPETESLLAHELAHTLQEQHGIDDQLGSPGGTSMPDRAVVEGAATYAQQAYDRRYLDVEPRDDGRFNGSEPYRKLNFAQYILGVRYVDDRVDDPSELDEVYENPPETTEQLLHGLEPGTAQPRDLSVAVEAGGYRAETRTTRGELAVNAVLSMELEDERAWAGAAGWGADELVRFRQLPGPDEEGYAWTLRWDSPAEADEFRTALTAFLDERADRADAADPVDARWSGADHDYRFEPVGDETVVLLVGTDGFVETAAATGTADDVTVALSDE